MSREGGAAYSRLIEPDMRQFVHQSERPGRARGTVVDYDKWRNMIGNRETAEYIGVQRRMMRAQVADEHDENT